MSYLHRYFLLKFFQIATPDDDPDNWRSKKQQAEQENEAPIIQAALTEINEVITTYLDSIDDQEVLAATRNKMIALVKKYAKDAKGKPSGDYRNVSTAKDATELLEKIKEFVKGE